MAYLLQRFPRSCGILLPLAYRGGTSHEAFDRPPEFISDPHLIDLRFQLVHGHGTVHFCPNGYAATRSDR